MQTFLSEVIQDVLKKDQNIAQLTFILPSKRAGIFLKDEIKTHFKTAVIFPEILSIEEFIQELSELVLIDNTALLFEFYSIYLSNTAKESIDDFEVFMKWATVVLQDFNEIDRHLVDANYIFSYLKDINQLEKWSLDKENETTLIKNYFLFFERLQKYYEKLYHSLIEKRLGYQGLLYREATENIHNYIESNRTKKLVFVGFNALNKSEETIIQELLENEIATIYWDTDSYYFENNQASSFFKKYQINWSYFQNNPFNWVRENFQENKNIKIVGAPKNNTQLKYVGEILSTISASNFQNTALVLADESILPLALNSIPKDVKSINITMGYDLKNIPVCLLFNSLLKLHINAKSGRFYYKDIIKVLNQASIKLVIDSDEIINEILKNNYIYLNIDILTKIGRATDNLSSIQFLFDDWQNDTDQAIQNCLSLLEILMEKTANNLEKEYVFKLTTIFQQIETLDASFKYIKNIKTLQQFYHQLLLNEKLSFQGEPLSGLQLMGMLETRVLDFETVIITSVNEGILPAGKSGNSFIPFDVKKDPKVNLPTYQEKDAIFSYHFYRLLQRAKNIYLLYNTESDQYGSGEQSRFITQLEINKTDSITKSVVSPIINTEKKEAKQLLKSFSIIDKLQDLATKGLSPTSLTNYIYNPIAFYQQKILGIRESEEAEETVAANTLGTVIHKTLESFYLPFKGKYLNIEDVGAMKKETASEVKKWFQHEYKNGDISSGKNLLIYNVAKQFVTNFLNKEQALLKEGNELKILQLEYDLETVLKIKGLNFTVKLRGQADRIDELNGTTRIIDYKTGKVQQSELNIKDWQLITTDYKKFSKSFQVLLYALMYAKMNDLDFDKQPVESGIISFKNLNAGFMKVNKGIIREDDMCNFLKQLEQLLLEIFNADIPFTEKENLPF